MSCRSAKVVCDSLKVELNQVTLLDDVTLAIEPGTWFGIVGPNGGGKSTFIKALLGLVPHQGSVQFHWPKTAKRRIGYMPQLAPFEPSLPITVNDYLRINCEKRPVWQRIKPNAELEALIVKLQISALREKRIGTLSMGERQRVLLCAALANQPDLLILDEPLAGIDKAGQQNMLAILKAYHDEGGTVMMIEHNWEVIHQYCEQVIWVDGTIVANDSPAAVFSKMQSIAPQFTLAQTA